MERYSVFSPNAGKYGPEITPYLDTFHVVYTSQKCLWFFRNFEKLFSERLHASANVGGTGKTNN